MDGLVCDYNSPSGYNKVKISLIRDKKFSYSFIAFAQIFTTLVVLNQIIPKLLLFYL